MTGHRFNPENVHKLHDPKREQLLPPEKIIREFGIKRGDTVADLGAGSGYFTLPIAKLTQQTVYAVDIEPQMLNYLQQRAEKENIDTIRYVISDLEKIDMEDGTADKIIAAFVLHEVSDLGKAFAEIKRILKPGGQALALEWIKMETESGPPLNERIPPDDFVNIARQNGFEAELIYPNEQHYGVLLTPIA